MVCGFVFVGKPAIKLAECYQTFHPASIGAELDGTSQ
jgi:hypothetical protein